MSKNKPQMIIVGGPNGAGKTTFVLETQGERSITYIGADQIAAEIRPDNPAAIAIAAGREFLRRINESIENQESIIVETTLSGKSFVHTIQRAKQAGHQIIIQMIFVESSNDSLQRVEARVRRGGHHVPSIDVQRRFPRSLQNFWLRYRELADQWLLTYNGVHGRQDVARFDGRSFQVFDEVLFEFYMQLAEFENDSKE